MAKDEKKKGKATADAEPISKYDEAIQLYGASEIAAIFYAEGRISRQELEAAFPKK